MTDMDSNEIEEGVESLSEHASKALQEFYKEKAEREVFLKSPDSTDGAIVEEDWELSQFWYDTRTADTLARVALECAGTNGRIACVSCPTIFTRLHQIKSGTSQCFVFEYDKRFQEIFPENFLFYDYNKPLDLPTNLKSSFDVVIADPPYLSKECLEKVSETVKFLAKDKIVLCTGAVMEDTVNELLGLRSCKFRPCHVNNLGNEFKCFANFEFDKCCETI